MMKRLLAFLLAILVSVFLIACGSSTVSSDDTNPLSQGKKVTLNVDEFESLLQQLPVSIKATNYTVQDAEHKTLYPDMLQVILENNTSADIKNAIVAFVAWDVNNLPVKIKGSIDFSDGSYIKLVNYADINMVPNSTYGENSGFEIDETCGISTFKALVVSCETFNGDTWENPYYNDWCKLYEGVKYSNDLTVNVRLKDDVDLETNKQNTTKDDKDIDEIGITESDLAAQIETQEFRVVSTKYVVQHEEYKSLYPDVLQVILENNTSFDIKNAVVAFVAWDANNLPVKIKGSIDFSDGSYIALVNYNDINMIPNSTYGESSGYEIAQTCNISDFKAIVVSYETFEGDTWKNPLFGEWRKLYEGVKLP